MVPRLAEAGHGVVEVVVHRSESRGRIREVEGHRGRQATAGSLEEISNLIYFELCAFQDGPQGTWWNVLSWMDRNRGAAAGIVAVAHGHVTTHLPKLHKSGPLKGAYQANPVDLG